VKALLFDFNGTLSDDERVQCGVYRELFAPYRPLTEGVYFAELAGLSDAEIIERWLGTGHPAAAELLEGRTRLVGERIADGSSVKPHIREAVRRAAEGARLAVVSGAARSEVEAVMRAGEIDVFEVVVTAEDVERGKPDPQGYLRALELLGLPPAEAAAIEDTPPGVAAAKAAGVYCAAVLGTVPRDKLHEADEIAPRLDAELVERLLAL
jgi:beta-phosphoglucomutase